MVTAMPVVLAVVLVGLVGALICFLIRFTFAAPGRSLVLAVATGALAMVAWKHASDTSTTPEAIAQTMQLPIPGSAVNCHVFCDGFEDTNCYFRCDIPVAETPALLKAAAWAKAELHRAGQSPKRPPYNSLDQPWWQVDEATSWICVPQGQVGESRGNSPQIIEPIFHSMLIDTSSADVHRVYMVHAVP